MVNRNANFSASAGVKYMISSHILQNVSYSAFGRLSITVYSVLCSRVLFKSIQLLLLGNLMFPNVVIMEIIMSARCKPVREFA